MCLRVRFVRFVGVFTLIPLAAACGGAEADVDTSQQVAPLRAASPVLTLTPLGTLESGLFAQGAAEIAAFDPGTSRLFSINAEAGTVDVVDLSDPTAPSLEFSILTQGSPNSVVASQGFVAVAVEAVPKTDPGSVEVYSATTGLLAARVQVGALPDMLTISPNGRWLVVANEGEPSTDYAVDPPGTVSIIRIRGPLSAMRQSWVNTFGFNGSTPVRNADSVRVFGPGAELSANLEPEYVAISHDSKKAWVALQENNAVAVVDLARGKVEEIVGLGFKDHGLPGNALDASDRDGAINIASWPVFGMYQPDGMAAFRARDGRDYVITTNEGDARDYDAFAEESRVSALALDPSAFPNAAELQANQALGRLTVTSSLGDVDQDGDFDALYAFGARSFSILDARANLVLESGDWLERITSEAYPLDFNSNNEANASFDNRSDNKGPEPESVVVTKLRGRTIAFVGMERISAIAAFEVSRPTVPVFMGVFDNRDFSATDPLLAGDLGPEGLLVIEECDSPTGEPLLVVSNEVSGSTTIYRVALE